jgi:hypothetical protein
VDTAEERPHRQEQDRWIWIVQELFIDVLAKFGTGVVALALLLLSVIGPIALGLVAPGGTPGSQLSDREHRTKSVIGPISLNFESPRQPPISFNLELPGRLQPSQSALPENKTTPPASPSATSPPSSQSRPRLRAFHDVLRHHIEPYRDLLPIPTFVFAFFFAYTVGSLLERLSVKRVDQISACFEAWKEGRHKRRKSGGYNPADELACDPKQDGCEFPYLHLRRYLRRRGLTGLADLVYWNGDEGVDPACKDYRSRNFIDILKIRIRYYGGQNAMHIIRNEAQIRLASAAWHAAWMIFLSSVLGMAWIVGYYLHTSVGHSPLYENQPHMFYYMTPSVITVLLSLFAIWAVLNCFHDLRLREVVQILATACMLYHDDPKTFRDIFNHCFALNDQCKSEAYGKTEPRPEMPPLFPGLDRTV